MPGVPRVAVLDDLDELTLVYAIERTKEDVFYWKNVAKRLGVSEDELKPLHSAIRQHARLHGLIPDAVQRNRYGVANFSKYTRDIVEIETGINRGRKVFVPETIGMPYSSHDPLLRQLFETPSGYLWDHMGKDGWFRLVDRVAHSLTPNHKGYALWRTNPANKT